jgi:ABC-type nitrate/sulfonate/bicarbonate transport system ATPase subunit
MEIKNIYKSFGDKVVFNDFSIAIPEQKTTFLMGESGSGKTTLLRIIAGLDKEFKGEISKNFDRISCVFQEPRLFDALTVRQNLEIIENHSNMSIEEALSIVELEDEQASYPSELSGGMKMRLSLARALIYNGDIFLMDEPFSALDENMKKRIIPRVFDFLKNKTTIIISHNQDEASTYANHIINL